MTPPNAEVRPAARLVRTAVVVLALALGLFAMSGTAEAARGARAHQARVLSVGDHGRAVRAVQRALHLRADGVYGRATRAAVKRFQRAHGLHADGRVGPATARALGLRRGHRRRGARHRRSVAHTRRTGGAAYGSAPKGALGPAPLHRGSRGRPVRVLQKLLGRIGYAVSVDGAFGRGTLRALRTFQRESDLAPDGIVNLDDAAALWDAVEEATPPPLAPGEHAVLGDDGLAIAPESAPQEVKDFIAAANRIAKKPYVYGGGHGKWKDRGYDCSGSISYALHGAGLLDQSLDSTGFESYGARGPGQWMTIYANAGHAYMMVAGLRFDTSGRAEDGSRWHDTKRPKRGYVVRHVPGL